MGEMFEVTVDWINQNATPAGGYKNEQLRIIGVPIPPMRGWPRSINGKLITQDQKLKFEAFHHGFKATKKSKSAMNGEKFGSGTWDRHFKESLDDRNSPTTEDLMADVNKRKSKKDALISASEWLIAYVVALEDRFSVDRHPELVSISQVIQGAKW